MNKFPNITELNSPPVPGKYYLVPCIKVNRRYLPVILPGHEDPEITPVVGYHYHYDWRFNHTNGGPFQKWMHGIVQSNVFSCKEIYWKRKKCFRTIEDIPFPKRNDISDKLEAIFSKCKLKKGLVCPHKGISLKSYKPDENGNVVCPGHGLQWNVNTGKMIKR